MPSGFDCPSFSSRAVRRFLSSAMSKLTQRLFPLIALPILLLLGAAEPKRQPSLLVYDFNLDMGPQANIDRVDAIGFDGIVTRVGSLRDVQKLEKYAAHAGALEDFDLLAFVPYDFADPDSPEVWRRALPVLADVGAPLWVIVRRAPSESAIRELLVEMAEASEDAGIETVLYPHWNTDIESAAEATDWIRRIGHPNLKNSLHTCHEIRSGNQNALPAVVEEHAELSALVTIAGADVHAYAGPPISGVTWSDAIKPLDRDAFSLQPFLQELRDSGYDGPVILHTFGITGAPGHLQRSLRRYDEYWGQIAP
ncbi:MAG: TIM barrel protein [Planctomycetota bacterium]